MFCSVDCREEFYKFAELSSGTFDSFKFLLNKIDFTFGGRKQLENYMSNHKPGITSFFDFDFSNVTPAKKQLNIYKSFLASVPATFASNKFSCDRYDQSTNELIVKLIRIFEYNSALSSLWRLPDVSFLECSHDYHANVFTTFLGLLNHSCVPNTLITFADNKVLCIVQNSIKANEQLFFAQG